MTIATCNVNGVNGRLLSQGRIDSTRHLHPGEVIYTCWDYGLAFRCNEGFRMDFLLLSPALASRLEEANVDVEFRGRDRAGDHAPTWVALRDLVKKPRPVTRSKSTAVCARARREPDIAP